MMKLDQDKALFEELLNALIDAYNGATELHTFKLLTFQTEASQQLNINQAWKALWMLLGATMR